LAASLTLQAYMRRSDAPPFTIGLDPARPALPLPEPAPLVPVTPQQAMAAVVVPEPAAAAALDAVTMPRLPPPAPLAREVGAAEAGAQAVVSTASAIAADVLHQAPHAGTCSAAVRPRSDLGWTEALLEMVPLLALIAGCVESIEVNSVTLEVCPCCGYNSFSRRTTAAGRRVYPSAAAAIHQHPADHHPYGVLSGRVESRVLTASGLVSRHCSAGPDCEGAAAVNIVVTVPTPAPPALM
jgi:hypothetical protein